MGGKKHTFSRGTPALVRVSGGKEKQECERKGAKLQATLGRRWCITKDIYKLVLNCNIGPLEKARTLQEKERRN